MKKLFAMLLSVAIILSTITIPAYAETGEAQAIKVLRTFHDPCICGNRIADR